MTTTLDITIGGMNCDHCVASIERALSGMTGVANCDVHVGGARVALDEQKVTRAELFSAIGDAGDFSVTGFAAVDN